MADPETTGARAELQREDAPTDRGVKPNWDEKRVRWLLLVVFVLVVLGVIGFAYLS